MINTILNAASRSADLTQSLLVFSHKGVKESTQVAVNDLLAAVIGLLERTIDKGIRLGTRLGVAKPIVLGDPTLLQNALLNLGINARDAMPEGGVLTYATSEVTLTAADCSSQQLLLSPGTYLHILVSDTGTGIPREIIGRIFEPFFTTKEQGKGTGLGLAAVYGTVRDHKGSISVNSEPGRGTVFNIFLPLCRIEPVPVVPNRDVVRGSGCILLVDDEELLRSMGCDLLETLGYTVLLAEDGAQALERYTAHRNTIDLVILDVIMPEMGGKATFLCLKELNPDVRVLFCSGFHLEGTDQELIELGACGFIQKPFSIATISKTVAASISG